MRAEDVPQRDFHDAAPGPSHRLDAGEVSVFLRQERFFQHIIVWFDLPQLDEWTHFQRSHN